MAKDETTFNKGLSVPFLTEHGEVVHGDPPTQFLFPQEGHHLRIFIPAQVLQGQGDVRAPRAGGVKLVGLLGKGGQLQPEPLMHAVEHWFLIHLQEHNGAGSLKRVHTVNQHMKRLLFERESV